MIWDLTTRRPTSIGVSALLVVLSLNPRLSGEQPNETGTEDISLRSAIMATGTFLMRLQAEPIRRDTPFFEPGIRNQRP